MAQHQVASKKERSSHALSDFPSEALARRLQAGRWRSSLVIAAEPAELTRTNITGPLVLFANRHGNSVCTVEGQRYHLSADTYVINPPGARFSLEYESRVSTFNVHFEEALIHDWLVTRTHPNDLEAAADISFDHLPAAIDVLPQCRRRDDVLDAALSAVNAALQVPGSTVGAELNFEAALCGALDLLLTRAIRASHQRDRVPATKAATRSELQRRIERSVDHLHANYDRGVSVVELAKVACLSRFHYLRSFRHYLGVTPGAYLRHLRLDEAKRRLLTSRQSLEEMAYDLGYSDASALSRAFRRRFNCPPSEWRRQGFFRKSAPC